MAAAFAELIVAGGLQSLHCPATGREVFGEDGFDPDRLHTPHLRFFIDWAGETWVADTDQFDSETAEYQKAVIWLLSDPDSEDDQNTIVAKCVGALPASAIVFEILDPPMGSYDGSICYACFDLAASASDQDAIRLLPADAAGA